MSEQLYKFKKHQKVYFVFKRILDIIFSLIALLILLFPFLIIALIIKCCSKGPIFYKQERYGKNQKHFFMYKFRSMRIDAPEIAPHDMKDSTRDYLEYPWGKFMRKTSIDELPQFINILKGDMSFIGPRPGACHNEEDLVEERLKYTPSAYDVKPGLSGYAQVKMKRDHSPDKKAYFDHYYAKHISFWFDLKVFILSFLVIFGFNPGK